MRDRSLFFFPLGLCFFSHYSWKLDFYKTTVLVKCRGNSIVLIHLPCWFPRRSAPHFGNHCHSKSKVAVILLTTPITEMFVRVKVKLYIFASINNEEKLSKSCFSTLAPSFLRTSTLKKNVD